MMIKSFIIKFIIINLIVGVLCDKNCDSRTNVFKNRGNDNQDFYYFDTRTFFLYSPKYESQDDLACKIYNPQTNYRKNIIT